MATPTPPVASQTRRFVCPYSSFGSGGKGSADMALTPPHTQAAGLAGPIEDFGPFGTRLLRSSPRNLVHSYRICRQFFAVLAGCRKVRHGRFVQGFLRLAVTHAAGTVPRCQRRLLLGRGEEF